MTSLLYIKKNTPYKLKLNVCQKTKQKKKHTKKAKNEKKNHCYF